MELHGTVASMGEHQLNKAPLIEAILEIKWKLKKTSENTFQDPHYKIFLGRLFDRLEKEYPSTEELPASTLPDELTPWVVHHRFRKTENGWPLVQVGPGIVTLNETTAYEWGNFLGQANSLIGKLYDSYPKPSEIVFQSIQLRYINAIEFDFVNQNAYDFLRGLKLEIDVPKNLFESDAPMNPMELVFYSAFRCVQPSRHMTLKFSSGRSNAKPALLWEIAGISADPDVPKKAEDLNTWITQVHASIERCFFKLIAGDLHKRFK